MEWIITDDDSFQICRKNEELTTVYHDDVFELYQVQQVLPDPISADENGYSVAHGIVPFREIDVGNILACYGYESLAQVQEYYGDEWKQILAECDFELAAGCMENLVSPALTWQETVRLICRMSGLKYQEVAYEFSGKL